MNTWPGGERHAISQGDHERWNDTHYPGTRQLCSKCDVPTGRCEDDSIYTEGGEGPLCLECLECWENADEHKASHEHGA